jgi:hypothetical protein
MTDGMKEALAWVRVLLTGITLLVPAALVALSGSAWLPTIPDRVAFHWDARGRVDSTVLSEPLFLSTIIGAVIAFVVGVIVLLVPRIDPRARRSSMYWIGTVAAFIAAAWLIPAGLTFRAGSPDSAQLDGWLAGFLIPLIHGGIPWLLTPKAPPADTHTPQPIPLAPTQVGAWTKTINTPLLYIVAGAITVLAAVIYVPLMATGNLDAVGIVGLIVMVLAALAVMSFAGLRATVDRRGLRVVSLLTRTPFKRIGLDHVREVEVTDLDPGEWGGWGYRVMSGRSAIILRAGPGLIVTTIDGTQFALTLSSPEVPAGLLRTLADSAAPPTLH